MLGEECLRTLLQEHMARNTRKKMVLSLKEELITQRSVPKNQRNFIAGGGTKKVMKDTGSKNGTTFWLLIVTVSSAVFINVCKYNKVPNDTYMAV